jgi:molecular chaperone DnaK (HSP70)
MDYRLGVDLGTTYTAAAILQGDEPEIMPLGDHEAFIPSVIVLQRDADLLVGEPAERRSVMSPGSTAREFKRRLGDSTPVILDGVPYSAHALMATVLRWVLDQVSARQGGPPVSVAITLPGELGGVPPGGAGRGHPPDRAGGPALRHRTGGSRRPLRRPSSSCIRAS